MDIECRTEPDCRCYHCAEVAQHARKQLHDAMLANARAFLKREAERFIPPDEPRTTVFDLSTALAIFTCSTKESTIEELLGLSLQGKKP